MRQCRSYVEVYRRSKDRRSKNRNLLCLNLLRQCISISRTKYNDRRSKSTDVRTSIFDVDEQVIHCYYRYEVLYLLRRLLRLISTHTKSKIYCVVYFVGVDLVRRLDEVNLLEIYFVCQSKFTSSCQNDRVYTVEVNQSK